MKYRFGHCELALDSHTLTVRGSVVPIEPQVFDLLAYLVGNPERLIPKDELVSAVWKGRIVSDSAINARISAARSAVEDSGSTQTMIKTVPRRGYRFVGTVEPITRCGEARGAAAELVDGQQNQQLGFCISRDGTRIAHARSGEGYPLVRVGHWLTHLDHDWHSPLWKPALDELGKTYSVIRYDQRGNGLSDWAAKDFSLEKFVEDLEAVVEAAGVERFALYGASQGAPIAVTYASRHPELVSHLILHGGFVRGRFVRASDEEREQGEALLSLIRLGWGKPGGHFLKAFSSIYIPEGTKEQIDSLAELQKLTTSTENAARIRAAVDSFDVADLLDQVAVPTLVIHARNDGVQPLDQGRKLCAGIKGAEFVMLESSNHVILNHEPAWDILFDSIRSFVHE